MANEGASKKMLDAIYNRQRTVKLEHCAVGSFQKIFEETIRIDPRIIVYIDLEKLEYTYSKNSIISFSEDYDVKIEYTKKFMDISEIIYISKGQNAQQMIDYRRTNDLCFVGEDIDSFVNEFDKIYTNYSDTIEEFDQIYWETMTYEQYTILNVHVQFLVDKNEFLGYQRKVDFAVKQVIASIKNISRIPIFLKAFLAFSYVSQNCIIDRYAQEEKLLDSGRTSYPHANLAYGAFYEKKATSKGISWMLKHILDEMEIENIVISGRIQDQFLNSDNYCWNLAKIDGVYYHIDATWNIDMDGIFVGGFMKDDNFMFNTHQWYDRYPSAKGTRFDYDYVEDYLIENGEDLLGYGIPEELLFPEPVNDF